MIAKVAAMTFLLLFVSGVTASGCYWALRSSRGWQATIDLDDISGEGSMAIVGAGIALACFVPIARITFELVR